MNGRFVRSVLAAALLCLGCGSMPGQAASINGIEQVVVCDPANPTNCIKPASDGSIATTGASGGGGDASAANQTAVQAVAGSDATKAVSVQGITGGKAVKVDGSAVTQPVSAASLPLPSGASTAANQTTGNTSLGTIATNTTGIATSALQTTGNTSLATIATNSGSSIPAGTNVIGKVSIDQTTLGTTNAVQPIAGTTGGVTPFTLTAAASTNATNVKASAGTLYHIGVYNNSATAAWLSFYNTAGTPTCGTSIVYQTMIPGNTSGAGAVEDIAVGMAFGTGIGICVTTGIAGTGSVAATSYVIGLGYK